MSVRLIKKQNKSMPVMPHIIEMINTLRSLNLSEIEIAPRHLWLNILFGYILNRIDLVVDTYLANIMFDVIHILSGLTSHIFSHDD